MLITLRLSYITEKKKSEILVQLARINDELVAIGKKQEVAFTWLHTNRAKVMIEAYGKLQKVKKLLDKVSLNNETIASGKPPIIELENVKDFFDTFNAATEDAISYVSERQILFDVFTVARVMHLQASLAHYALLQSNRLTAFDGSNSNVAEAERLAAVDPIPIADRVEEALEILEKQFRSVLDPEPAANRPTA